MANDTSILFSLDLGDSTLADFTPDSDRGCSCSSANRDAESDLFDHIEISSDHPSKPFVESPVCWDLEDMPLFDAYNVTSTAPPAGQLDDMTYWPSFSSFGQRQLFSPALDNIKSINIEHFSLPGGHSLSSSAPKSQHVCSTICPTNNVPRSMATLTVAVQAQLQKIAMPPHLRRSLSNSSSTSESKDSAHLSDDGGSANPRKHKMEDTNEVQDKNVNDDYKPMKRTPHNMIERRYRNKLNDEIARLRDSVPSLRIMSKSARGEDVTKDREDLHGLTPAHKLNKATVISKATEYIRHLEKRDDQLLDQTINMQRRLAAFEKLFMAGVLNNGAESCVEDD
jgi:hypothetical protein